MEWEHHNMDYQPRQQLANALDLSSRLAQKEQTKQQQQQRQSSLFNALNCCTFIFYSIKAIKSKMFF